ncbi:cell division protein FtsQ/DivIB [Paenibacillus thermoaerophilus]|uniref:Cell division protein FtsQ/DivIB n=1 Tax=Paenibacillus thermoaerophilus TaxID=1215385 RepID=A0ABW2V354_9BACL|nr:FtsQ-type POTRA domain-containing protein [Paenibacillus thermoaerophilus]TMV19082.1 FtsQ-type POTRA domain-containing protein [Paenibacillus thermoaerophilus]
MSARKSGPPQPATGAKPDLRMPVLPKADKPPRRSYRRLTAVIVLFFFILFGVLFFQSSISKVGRIEVSGNAMALAEEIVQASGVEPGDHFFGFRGKTVEERVRKLPVVADVAVAKIFPGLVRIEVKEHPKVAYQLEPDGKLSMVLANGHKLPANPLSVPDRPLLTGWGDNDPWKAKLTAQLAKIPDQMLYDLSEIRPAPSEHFPDKIRMYTRSHYEVIARIDNLPEKIELLDDLIYKQRQKETELNKSEPGYFTMLDTVYFTPYAEAANHAPEASVPEPSAAPRP